MVRFVAEEDAVDRTSEWHCRRQCGSSTGAACVGYAYGEGCEEDTRRICVGSECTMRLSASCKGSFHFGLSYHFPPNCTLFYNSRRSSGASSPHNSDIRRSTYFITELQLSSITINGSMAFTFVASNASLLPALRIPSPLPTSFSRRPRHLPFFTFQCQRHRVVTCSAAPAPPPPSPSPTDSPLIQETPCFTRNIMATPMPMHHREVYLSAVADAVRAHLSDYVANPTPQNFAQVTLLPPQLNPELDVFDRRFLLQYVWRILSVTSSFGLRARVLIQGSRRFGATPLSIQGLRRTFDADLDLSRETWPPGAVRSGELELDSDIDDDDDIVLLLSPTNAVSIPVTESLADLVERVAHRPIILLNPRLADIPSHSGVMQVAGRAERISLLEKFHQIFYMRLLFDSGKVFSLLSVSFCRP